MFEIADSQSIYQEILSLGCHPCLGMVCTGLQKPTFLICGHQEHYICINQVKQLQGVEYLKKKVRNVVVILYICFLKRICFNILKSYGFSKTSGTLQQQRMNIFFFLN